MTFILDISYCVFNEATSNMLVATYTEETKAFYSSLIEIMTDCVIWLSNNVIDKKMAEVSECLSMSPL